MPLVERFAMDKKGWIILIFVTLVVNIIMLQMTIEAYHGEEVTKTTTCMMVAIVSSAITLISYLQWKKLEYKK